MRKLLISLIGLLLAILFLYLAISLKNNYFYILVSLSIAVASVFMVLFLNRNQNAKIKSLEDRLLIWNDISYHINQAGDEVFNNLPIAIIVYDDHDNIKWGNGFAKQLFKSRLEEEPLESLSADFFNQIKKQIPRFVFQYEDSFYDVISNVENKLIYIFDATSREKLNIKYDNRTNALGVIMLDNLEDSMKDYDIQERANIRGQFLGEISDYMRKFHASLQNVDDDKLFFQLDKKNLKLMEEDKLDILNQVREIAHKNHLRTSMSIGIACYDVLPDELQTLAQSAVELAEKRGGDQAVVNIQDEQIKFYGGKSNAVEKNTMVDARMHATALKEAIEASQSIYITGHQMPDTDCIGSMIGVYKMAKSSGKEAYMVIDKVNTDIAIKRILKALEEEAPDTYDDIIGLSDVEPRSNSLLIVCDTQSPKIMIFPELLEMIPRLCVIDHHRRGEIGFENCIDYYVETYASSAVELVSEMFSFYNKGIQLLPIEASVMLSGMVIDTNNFTFRSSARTFDAASILKDFGADMIEVRKLLRENLIVEQSVARAILSSRIFLDKYAIATLDTKIDDRRILAKISDKLLEVDGVLASFTIGKIKDDEVGISARSLDTFNVQVIMEEMNGGGHLNSAAAQLKNMTIDEVVTKLSNILRDTEVNEEDKKMKVILVEDVKGRGKKNDIIDVANGYGTYLLNNKLAISATPENVKKIEEQKRQELLAEETHKNLMLKLKSEIEQHPINVYIKLGQDGKPFGHITNKQICEEYEAQTGITLDKRKVTLSSEINSVGIFSAQVELHKGIVAKIELHVMEK
jgi:ribosomal protein L9